MLAQWVVSASARVEQGMVAAVLVLGVVFLWGLLRHRGAIPSGLDQDAPLSRRREAALLAALLAAATLVRTAGWDRSLTALFWFSEVTTLHVAKLLREGRIWSEWMHVFRNSQVAWEYESPILLPITTAFQYVLGPSLHLPVLLGALWGVTAVLLGWAFGRAWRSPAYGLVFGAFLAVSPLEIAWSRVNGYFVACVAHLLLTLWIGFAAGRRGRPALAILTAVAIWTSLYHYFPARMAMPLGTLALLAGAQRAHLSLGRTLGMLLVVAGTLAVFYLLAAWAGFAPTIWPHYPGYMGDRGERSLREVIERNAGDVATQLRATLVRYFVATRTTSGWARPELGWGMSYGGLCLAPVGILGLVGLGYALRFLRTEWLLLVLTMAGLSVPALSLMSARRALILDLAWCALAAHGVLVLARLALRAGGTRRTVAAGVAVLLAGLGAWSFGTLVALTAGLPRGYAQPIPFGASGFGDGITCLHCMDAAHEWQAEIERGAFVVSFDNDLDRENATSPAGLVTYGRVAALAAGRPQSFVEMYDLMRNLGGEPPSWGPLFDESKDDFASYLDGLIAAAAPAVIVWHFERPTQWERWLADGLVAAGGAAREFETPLSPVPALQVRMPPSARDAVSSILRGLTDTPTPGQARCIRATERARRQMPSTVLSLSGVLPGREGGLPAWIAGSWHTVLYGDAAYQMPTPVGTALARDDGVARLHLLSRDGQDWMYEVGATTRTERTAIPVAPPGPPHGLDCAELVAGEWWLVDPLRGEVRTSAPGGTRLPAARWTGIARGPNDELVLASADQFLAVFDAGTQTEMRRFPATVRASRKNVTGECSPILAGDGWYGTYSYATATLRIYDQSGRRVGRERIDRLLGIPRASVTMIGAVGSYVAVAIPGEIQTYELRLVPDCVDEAQPVP